MSNLPLFFKLYSACIPVKGASRSIICDLERSEIRVIPEELYEILTEKLSLTQSEIFQLYGEENVEVIREYFDYLESEQYGFWTDQPELFPPMNMDWDSPGLIDNAVIDFRQDSSHDLVDIISQLEELGCQHIEFRCYDLISIQDFEEMLYVAKQTRLRSIELLVKYCPELSTKYLKKVVEENNKIYQITVHSAPNSELVRGYQGALGEMGHLIYTKEEVNSEMHCGIVHMHYFTYNLEMFTESKNFNSCLNKKLSIDSEGNIKNCPALSETYGSVREKKLVDALENKSFKKYWNISKDQISVCKDCEFRYVCTDCRAFVTDANDVLSKPRKCLYNPYTNEWEK